MQYEGIKKPDGKSKGNLGTIWTKREDGKYSNNIHSLVLEEWQIKHDLGNGYLKIKET